MVSIIVLLINGQVFPVVSDLVRASRHHPMTSNTPHAGNGVYDTGSGAGKSKSTEQRVLSRAILGNPDVLGSGSWAQMLQNDFWGTPLADSGSHGSYRPLCVASFKLNYLLDGFKPFGYHLVNVLLHSLATGLVVKLARHILPAARSGAAVAGLLFAAHPIHTEAVAGVVGRADLTGCIFYLLALLAYIRHVRWRQWGDGRHWLALVATLLLAGAAVLCKETAVTALVVCAIYDIIKGYAGSRDKRGTVGFVFFVMGTTGVVTRLTGFLFPDEGLRWVFESDAPPAFEKSIDGRKMIFWVGCVCRLPWSLSFSASARISSTYLWAVRSSLFSWLRSEGEDDPFFCFIRGRGVVGVEVFALQGL
uniref:Glycosyltransferase RgtA/B/C/D-like domain-containing protein n=1 Tax=Anopheles atroparvus TaxID=41427 RepID=A0A182JC79_ANOAO